MDFRQLFVRAGAGMSLLWIAGLATAAPHYKLVDLGAAISPYPSAVTALNRSGVAVGSALMSDSLQCAVFDHGNVATLGTLGGPSCFVGGINDGGTIVGSSSLDADSGVVHAFAYRDGVMTDLGTYPGFESSEAVDINNRGQIVGNTWDAIHNKVFVYRNGLFRHIPAPAGTVNVYAGGLNDNGDVTGAVQIWSDHRHAFVYRDDTAVDLGTLGNLDNGESAGVAINDKGQIAGWSSGIGFRSHAVRITDGKMEDLGTIPPDDSFATSIATGIDNRGWVVGVSDDGGGNTCAFLFDGKTTFDLNLLLDKPTRRAWHLTSAQSINKSGEITGMAVSLDDGSLHVFLATPLH